MAKKYDITALGEILIDFTAVTINNKKYFQQNAGGAPANVVVAATKLGSKTSFIGKVGNDMHGKFLKGTLENEDVCTKGLIFDNDYFTTLAFVDINEFKERSFSFARKPGADTQLQIDEFDEKIIKESKIFHVGSLSLTHSKARTTTHQAIKIAKENNVIVSYDPNYRESLWENEEEAKMNINSIVPDIIKISDEELELVTNTNDYEIASKVLFNEGIKIIVITLGEKGCFVYNKNGGKIVEGYKSEVVDTTGAGDAFWGAFLSKINHLNYSLEELLEFAKFANATASICVENIGAIPSLPSLEQVLKKCNN